MSAWENKEPENWGTDKEGARGLAVTSPSRGRGGVAYRPSPVWGRMVTFPSVLREVPQTPHTGATHRSLWLLSKESMGSPTQIREGRPLPLNAAMRARCPPSPADHSRCEECVPQHLCHVRHRATTANPPSRERGRALCHGCPRPRKESIHHRVCVVTSRSSCPGHSPWPRGLSAAPQWPGCSTAAHRRSPGECWGRAQGCPHLGCTQSSCSSLMKKSEGEGLGPATDPRPEHLAHAHTQVASMD